MSEMLGQQPSLRGLNSVSIADQATGVYFMLFFVPTIGRNPRASLQGSYKNIGFLESCRTQKVRVMC